MEISGFYCHLIDFTWKQLWSYRSPKNCHFDHLSSYEFWILENFSHFQEWNFFKNQNSKPSKLLKQHYSTFWNQTKLISCKIRVAAKLLNFHTVKYPQSKYPIRLPRSVLSINVPADCYDIYILYLFKISSRTVLSILLRRVSYFMVHRTLTKTASWKVLQKKRNNITTCSLFHYYKVGIKMRA